MSYCDSCGSEQLGEAGYCSSSGTSPHPFPSTGQLPSPIRWYEVRRALRRTAIGIVAIIGLLIIVAMVADLSHLPGSVRAAGEPATPSLAQAKIEAESVSLDELFRENERRILEAVDARAKINQPINASENAVEISGKSAPSEERLLHNLPPKQAQEEPLGY